MIKNEVSLFEQKFFRGIVISGTGVTLGVMLGSLAFIQGRDASGFQFDWSWWSLPLFLASLGFNYSFWQAVFNTQSDATPANKSKVAYHLFIVLAIGIGAFLYPIRFLEQKHYFEIARGLATAVIFLGGVGVMLYKVGQGLFAKAE